MDAKHFSVEVLAEWVRTNVDFEQLLDQLIKTRKGSVANEIDLRKVVRGDFHRLQGANLEHLRRLKGNPERLKREIAAILRW